MPLTAYLSLHFFLFSFSLSLPPSVPPSLPLFLPPFFLFFPFFFSFSFFLPSLLSSSLSLFLFFYRTLLCHRGSRTQWCHHSSLQLQTRGLKKSSHFSLPSSWDYRCAPPHLAKFCYFCKDRVLVCCPGFFSNSWPQAFLPPQPPKAL